MLVVLAVKAGRMFPIQQRLRTALVESGECLALEVGRRIAHFASLLLKAHQRSFARSCAVE
jgi:hypothetical protein